jgi:F0F1-type ATP synthase assembly protein I
MLSPSWSAEPTMRLPTPNDRQRALAAHNTSAEGGAAGLETGLSVASYPIGGIVAYGFIGWLVGKAIHAGWPLPAGMILGLAIGTAYIIYRHGTKTGSERASAATAKATAKAEAKAEAKAKTKTEATAKAKAMAKSGQRPAVNYTTASATPRKETYR